MIQNLPFPEQAYLMAKFSQFAYLDEPEGKVDQSCGDLGLGEGELKNKQKLLLKKQWQMLVKKKLISILHLFLSLFPMFL